MNSKLITDTSKYINKIRIASSRCLSKMNRCTTKFEHKKQNVFRKFEMLRRLLICEQRDVEAQKSHLKCEIKCDLYYKLHNK